MAFGTIAAVAITAAVVAFVLAPQLYTEPTVPTPPDPNPTIQAAQLARYATEHAGWQAAVSTTRTTVLAALAGVGALLTIGINFRNTQIATETFRIAERGHLTDRYAKAIELLGDADHLPMRLGGIYALQQLAQDTTVPGDRATVREVLAAFVRTEASERATSDEVAQDENAPSEPSQLWDRVDIRAAMSALGRIHREGEPRADLSNCDLSNSNLANVDLTGARLSRTNLSHANLRGAQLSSAQLHSTDAFYADLTEADLTEADLTEARLTRASLDRARLQRAQLIGARIISVSAIKADLTGARLERTSNSLVRLNNANLSGACLANARLQGADLTESDLTWASLVTADLSDALLARANLSNADLTNAKLCGARLIRTHLLETNLKDARLDGANLTGSHATDWDGYGAIGTTEEQLAVTRLRPDGNPGPSALIAPRRRGRWHRVRAWASRQRSKL